MQARLSLIRFPSFLVASAFALAAALILGGVLGYTLKPAVGIPGRTQVLVVHDPATTVPSDGCIWVTTQKKAC